MIILQRMKGFIMRQNYNGHIFVHYNDIKQLTLIRNLLASQTINIIGTNNFYQLQCYVQTLNSDAVIFHSDADNPQQDSLICRMSREINAPTIIIRTDENHPNNTNISAHQICFPRDYAKFKDIIESYCRGHRNHHILFITNNTAHTPKQQQDFIDDGYSIFSVPTIEAARKYLQKNTPASICLDKSLSALPFMLNNRVPHIFYVDRQQDITEIKKFLH